MTDDAHDPREPGEPGEPGDQEPNDAERAEAQALAAALDGEPSASAPPEDAFATALLVRHGGARGELSAERSEAILGELLQAQTRTNESTRGTVVRLWPWGAALAAAAAIAIALWQPLGSQQLARAPGPKAAQVVPQASASLLAAQTALLRAGLARMGTTGDYADAQRERTERFERELRAYRGELFRALHAKYPAKVGVLEPELRRAP